MIELRILDTSAMESLGARLIDALKGAGGIIFLSGELGAGKTTLVRGALRHLGVQGPVRSPTYTLIEPYELPRRMLYHIDLYRLAEPEELDYLGLRELDCPEHMLFIEWPERGANMLPPPDIRMRIEPVREGRRVGVTVSSERGRQYDFSVLC